MAQLLYQNSQIQASKTKDSLNSHQQFLSLGCFDPEPLLPRVSKGDYLEKTKSQTTYVQSRPHFSPNQVLSNHTKHVVAAKKVALPIYWRDWHPIDRCFSIMSLKKILLQRWLNA
jgi:hypothetical protein